MRIWKERWLNFQQQATRISSSKNYARTLVTRPSKRNTMLAYLKGWKICKRLTWPRKGEWWTRGKNANRLVAVVQAGQETRHRLNRTELHSGIGGSCLLDDPMPSLPTYCHGTHGIFSRTTDIARDTAFRVLAGTILLFRTRWGR